jgi:hypothetical protein
MNSSELDPLRVLQARPRIDGSRVGTIVRLQRRPMVDFSGNPLGPQPARVVSSLSADTLAMAYGARLPVLLVFEEDDPSRPVIVDVVMEELSQVPDADAVLATAVDRAVSPGASADGWPTLVAYATTIVGVEANAVLVHSQVVGEGPVKAATAIVLRNLKDPVVVVMLSSGSAVVVGQIYSSVPVEPAGGDGADVSLRAARVTIEADSELILRAGGCEIRLDARGKAATTADTIVSRARGTNKVQGGSVHLN